MTENKKEEKYTKLINALKKQSISLEVKQRITAALNNELAEDKKILRKQHAELKKANEKLENHIKNQRILYRNLIHEVKNKFNEIYAQFNFIKQNSDNKNIEKAITQTNIIQNDFENLLEWTKKYSLDMKPEITNFRFNLIVENIKNMYPIYQGNMKIIKKYNTSASIKTDKKLLEIIVHNLIKNSLNCRNKGLIIKILFTEDYKFYRFEFIDNGKGFNKAFLKNQDFIENTGLGLILVKKFVETLGGTIQFENVESEGAKVSFSIKNYDYFEI